MPYNLTGFGIPYIIDSPKSKEEKIEEARRSGLIGDRGPKDLAGALQGQQMCCKRCGSRNVKLLSFDVTDLEKGCEIFYYCKNCGYEGTRAAKVRISGTWQMKTFTKSMLGKPAKYTKCLFILG